MVPGTGYSLFNQHMGCSPLSWLDSLICGRTLCERPSESLVCLLDIHVQLSRLLLTQLLRSLHLVERNQPLDNLASVVKVLVRDLVDGLDDVGQQRMELVFRQQTQFDSIQECDKFLRGFEDKNTAGIIRGGGSGGRGGGRCRYRRGHACLKSFRRAGGFELGFVSRFLWPYKS